MRLITFLALLCPMVLPGQSLRDLADQRGIRFGTAVAPNHFSEAEYSTILAREFNQAEPENVMKFGLVHPGPKDYNFDPGDKIVQFAQSRKMMVRGHTLVWHNQVANWVKQGNLTPEQLSAILEEHIKTVVGHFAGKVYAWDVVNEAFESGGSLRKTLWSGDPQYVERAFRWAHEADPKALLFYNDYAAEVMNPKSDAIYKMAQDFKARGVPLDGIGMQMHIALKTGPISSMQANMQRLTDLGLQVQITELDVKVPVDSSRQATPESLETQARVYHDIVALCVGNPHCTAIQTWGFTDRYSWIPAVNKGYGAALPFDENYQPKPAYKAIEAALQSAR